MGLEPVSPGHSEGPLHFLCPAAACEETSDGKISASARGDLPTELSVRQSREAGIVAKGPRSRGSPRRPWGCGMRGDTGAALLESLCPRCALRDKYSLWLWKVEGECFSH